MGTKLNTNLDTIDNLLDGGQQISPDLTDLEIDGTIVTATPAELNILDGVTATTAELNVVDGITATVAELNILDGVTSTAAELNALDGITSTVTELNYTDGVTSNIQTQLGTKLPLTGGTMTGTIAGFTSTGIDDNATSTAITLNSSGSVNFNGLIGQMTGAYCYLRFRDDGIADTITIDSRKKVASGKGNIRFTTTDSVGSTSERLKITGDGRGLSQFTAKAWVNFNGTGTVAINDSHNVSSITDSGVGMYYINFTNSLANANHASTATPRYVNGSSVALTSFWDNIGSTARTPLLVVSAVNAAWSTRDSALITAITFGD